MKKLFFLLCIFVNAQFCIANYDNDSTKKVTGWFLFINHEFIFLPDSLTTKVNRRTFFKKRQYDNGILLSYFPDIEVFRKMSKSFWVESGTNKIRTRINLVPVKSTMYFRPEGFRDSEPLNYLLYRKRDSLELTYRFTGLYYIDKLDLLKQEDYKARKSGWEN